MSTHVNADNFIRVETARMFGDIQRSAGGVNLLSHHRQSVSIDAQTVIRMNRDTLYSFAVVDLSGGATLEIPETGGRYLSVMIVDQDHYVRAVLHDAGSYDLTEYAPDAGHVLLAARTLVDADDPEDQRRVAEVQDGLRLEAGSAVPFAPVEHDTASLDATRSALLSLAAGLTSFERTFGGPDDVDPVRHLIGTAAGWGGLPITEASYVGVDPGLPVGFYDLTMKDVPADAFWSISVYNRSGYFEPNDDGRYSVNSVMGERDEDGSITVHFVPPGEAAGTPNAIVLPEGWNYLVRLYRPRPEFFDGSWQVPDLVRRRDRETEAVNGAEALPETGAVNETEMDAEVDAGEPAAETEAVHEHEEVGAVEPADDNAAPADEGDSADAAHDRGPDEESFAADDADAAADDADAAADDAVTPEDQPTDEAR